MSHALVLALRPPDAAPLTHALLSHGLASRVTVLQAINGSEALLRAEALPLYTRHLLRHGRRDHMQIGNPEMLGCLLSHMKAWRLVRPGEVVAVFEVSLQLPFSPPVMRCGSDCRNRRMPKSTRSRRRAHACSRKTWRGVNGTSCYSTRLPQ